MKAARFHQTGSPDVIQIDDAPQPVPAAGEVVIRVKAAALNRMDVFLRSGQITMPGFSLPHTGGFDIAGDIEAVGPGVAPNRRGEPVLVKARITGPTARGRLDIIGIARPGGLAEYVLAPASAAIPKPANYSYEEAAAFPCVYLTAWCGLVLRAAVRPGETVLVHAGGGGAGVAAIQVAKLVGASVITTVSNPAKAEKAKSLLGADRVINYRNEDLVASVMDFTKGRGVDVVFDPVWGKTASRTIDCFNYGGRWIVLGMVDGPTAEITAANFMFKEVAIHGIVEFYATDESFAGAMNLAYQNRCAVIDKVWPLEKTAEAHRQMESGDFFGKIIVKP